MSISQKDRPEFKGKRALVTGGSARHRQGDSPAAREAGVFVFLNYARNDHTAVQTLEEFNAQGYMADLCKADLEAPREAVDSMLDHVRLRASRPSGCNAAYQENTANFHADLALMHKTLGVYLFQLPSSSGSRANRYTPTAPEHGICCLGHGDQVFAGTLAYDVSKAASISSHARRRPRPHPARHWPERPRHRLDHTPGERRRFTEEQQTAPQKPSNSSRRRSGQ